MRRRRRRRNKILTGKETAFVWTVSSFVFEENIYMKQMSLGLPLAGAAAGTLVSLALPSKRAHIACGLHGRGFQRSTPGSTERSLRKI